MNELGRQARALYRERPATTRLHVAGRWLSCPFPEAAEAIPTSGRILEVGCGHGLFACYLALESPLREVHGVDLDADKIIDARAAAALAARNGATVSFDTAPSGAVPEGPWDAITIIDVLYLLPHDEQRALIRECISRLAPGGVLVLKEVGFQPRWKYRWNLTQETLAVKVLRITEGHDMAFLSPDQLAQTMRDAGLEVTANHRVDRRRPHPHHLVVAQAPGVTPGRPATAG